MLAPTTGAYIDWARRLQEVFEVSPEVGYMRQSLEARCSSSFLPDIFRTSCGIISAQDRMMYLARQGSRASISSSQTVKQRLRRRYRNMWYGVRLHYAKGSVKSWSTAPKDPSYLYCKQRPSSTRTVAGAVVKIYNTRGRLVAFAPLHTRAGDWFAVSASSSCPTKESIGMVLRLEEFHKTRIRHTPKGSYVESRPYTILGQAALYREPEEDVFPLLDWEYFQQRWDAEDLLILHWAFFQSVVRDFNRQNVGHWLSVSVCRPGGSSDVNGHMPPDERQPTRMDYTYPVKYIHRPVDLELATPEATQFFPDAELLGLSDVWDEERFYSSLHHG